MGNMLIRRIDDVYDLEGSSRLRSEVAGKGKRVVRRLYSGHGTENAPDRRSLAAAKKRMGSHNEHRTANDPK
jgi:hypothetical protein